MIIDPNLNSCEDVLRFLVEHYEVPYDGILYYEGDDTLAYGANFDCCSRVFICDRYPEYVFLVREDDARKSIRVGIAKGNGCCIYQIPAIVLPKIAFNELAYELTQDERYMY